MLEFTTFVMHQLSTMALTLLVLFPLFISCILLLVPERIVRWVAILGAIFPFILAVLMYLYFDVNQTDLQFREIAEWLPELGIAYRVGVDGISLALILLNTLLTPLVILASWKEDRHIGSFLACLLALTGLVNGIFIASDFILFYVFFEASLIPLYILIGVWGGKNRVYAALKFFIYTFAGSVLMLVAGLWIGLKAGTFEFMNWNSTIAVLPLSLQILLCLAFLIAYVVA
jgi:NADH-quinone oxidoreductase subunit M